MWGILYRIGGSGMKIGKRLRHTMRYREILNAFFKNGFSHVLYRLGLTEQRKKSDEEIEMQENTNLQDVGVKLRRALQELGPTFIKLGQMISSRRDQVTKEVALELAKLQDDVESIPYAEVERILEFEHGNSLDELYQSFEEEPIASASIGQVHMATLHSGIEVAVKVQRPDIESRVETDLEIIRDLAGLMESRIKWARTYQVADRFEEFSTSLKEELDYENEGRNAERIRKQFVDQPEIYVPKIYWTHTTDKVLTMEAIHGIKITNVAELDAKGYNRQEIASRLADSIFHQVLTHGFFHGDPHPGNLLVLPNNCISYDREIYVPKIYWTHTTDKVLTMEAIHGIKITNVAELDAKGYNRQEIASRLADSIFHQVLTHGFFHGDPHPGNLLVLPNNCISYIDFGMVGKL